MDTSYLVRKERCPECAKQGKDQSKDNLGIYSDGHSYCFSCGFTIPISGISKFLSRCSSTGEVDKREHRLSLPEDSDTNYPTIALDWIKQYGLNRNDLLSGNVLWSNSTSRLIFPVYDGNLGLVAYQGRYFGPPAPEGSRSYPKWYGKGKLAECFNVLNPKGTTIVLVEDIVSSMKVSKITTSMSLYGSQISKERFMGIKKLGYINVQIFLDPDKRLEAIKFARLGKLLGLNTCPIFAEADPKELSIEKLKILLK